MANIERIVYIDGKGFDIYNVDDETLVDLYTHMNRDVNNTRWCPTKDEIEDLFMECHRRRLFSIDDLYGNRKLLMSAYNGWLVYYETYKHFEDNNGNYWSPQQSIDTTPILAEPVLSPDYRSSGYHGGATYIYPNLDYNASDDFLTSFQTTRGTAYQFEYVHESEPVFVNVFTPVTTTRATIPVLIYPRGRLSASGVINLYRRIKSAIRAFIVETINSDIRVEWENETLTIIRNGGTGETLFRGDFPGEVEHQLYEEYVRRN